MSVSRGRDVHFDVSGRLIAAQEWGDSNGLPVLALHGWLDNSASFVPLAGELKNAHLIALDMAGHGQSSHKAAGLVYNIWEDISDIFAVADQLGWDSFHLLGHSRGAIISALAAGTMPERVKAVFMVDAIVPQPLAPEKAPQQLAKSIREISNKQQASPRVFDSIEKGIEARKKGFHKMTEAASRLVVERGVKPVPGGYSWSSDARLMAASSFKLSEEHIKAFINAIAAPVELFIADSGLPGLLDKQRHVLDWFADLNLHKLEGGHFLHMENQVEAIADVINSYMCGTTEA